MARFQRSATGSCATRWNIRAWVLLLLALVSIAVSPPLFAQGAPQGGEAPKLTPLPHPEIDPPSVPEEAKPVGPIIGAVVVAFVALGVFTWLLLRKASVRPPALASPTKIALNRLIELRADSKKIAPTTAAGMVSSILREFQEAGFAVPAPYRTTDELYNKPEHVFEGVVKTRFSPVAQLYDRLSFGAQPVTRAEVLELIEKAMIAVSDDNVKDASAVIRSSAPEQARLEKELSRTGTSVRNLRFIKSAAFIGLGIFTLGLTWTEKLSPGGQSMAAAVGVLLVLIAAVVFKSALNTDPDERSFRPPADAPVAEHIAYHRTRLVACLFIFPVLSAVTIYTLNQLEHSAARQLAVLPPVAFFYRLGGYWPGVISVPALGLWSCLSHYLNLRRVLEIASARP